MIAAVTTPAQEQSAERDRRLLVAALASTALSIALLLVHAMGWTPLPVALPLVALPAAVTARCLVVWSRRSASASRRAQVALLTSWGGLAVACGSLALALPPLLRTDDVGSFLGDVAAHAWPLALLVALTLATRTLPLRAIAAAWFLGFFGITTLATLVGRPVIDALGASNPLASAVYAPVTEEILKAAPVLLIAVLASRRSVSRPSLGDLVLFGATIGAGFAINEDALFGRGGFDLLASPPLSLLFPAAQVNSGAGATAAVAGHLAYTALVSAGIAITVLYRTRYRWAWLAAPVAFALSVLSHVTANQVSLLGDGDSVPAWGQLTSLVTLDGYLVPVALLVVVVGGTVLELRALRRGDGATLPTPAWRRLLLRDAEAGRRATALAQLQQEGA